MHTDFNDSLDKMVRAYLFNQKAYDPERENSFVVSHVHRLDKLTSGLVIYAKNKMSLDILLTAIQNHHQIEKYYLLETKPNFPQSLIAKGWIIYDQNLKKSVYKDKIISSDKNYKTALTTFTLLESHQNYSLVEAQLTTGRKHQIRASLSFYGFPIINDFKYGGKKVNQKRMIYLKAYKLSFNNLPDPLAYLNNLVIEISTSFD
jgi:23S rRNA pseudouridine955/2504/2580 synthase